MSRPSALLMSLLLLAGPAPAASPAAPAGDAPGLVSPAWLADRLKDPNLVVLHVGEKPGYEAGHVPGAQFIALAGISTPRGEGLTLELPPLERLEGFLEGLGVGDDSHIVVYYGKDWVSPATRVIFTLDVLGLGGRTSLLDGGMPAWVAEGRPVTTDVKTPARGTLTPRPRPATVDGAWMDANLGKPGHVVVDARNIEFYTGAKAAGRPERHGHIPGAASIPFDSLLTAAPAFKPERELREGFRAAGVKDGDKVVAYCHIGQQATVVYFAARLLGIPVALYDGSFEDWSARGKPVEAAK